MTQFAPKCLCIDIETAATDALDLRKLAAWRPDTDAQLVVTSFGQRAQPTSKLNALTEGAAFVLGHNVIRHDLPVLRSLYPDLQLNRLPVVDTLELSPIAFPQNPYHSLVKDYKLVRDSLNDPLKDAQLTLKLWRDQFHAFEALGEQSPTELACYHYLLTQHPQSGLRSFFLTLRRALPPSADEVKRFAVALTVGKVCSTQIEAIVAAAIEAPAQGALPLAYLLAWLRVSGGNSVLPPWVHHQYPSVRGLIRTLRETACDAPGCVYCRTYLDSRKELERYFGYREFRAEPANASGGSLQEDIVQAAFAGRSMLAILPTGGGKSICYQLPALSGHWRSGRLTIIISPLQSLMKDQVDNLLKQGIFSGATLNGMLTMPERRDVLDKVRLGDIGLLLVSPEQFRSKAFTDAIRYREIGAWVFDEAHCLSKWGNDFRPDYLYVSRFIRERYPDGAAPIWCFTATANREVVEDLKSHFASSLGLALDVFDGGIERGNLDYSVMAVTQAEKHSVIQRLLEAELKSGPGGAIVFTARRKSAEAIAGFLNDVGWPCAYYHAGIEPGHKKEVQRAFIDGELRVIVATNAFGMGVDKPDVRLVIHAEIPGSLENYLQEAGRAGRDRGFSRCVLLYDEADVDTQFSISATSQLSRHDIAGILRVFRRYSTKTKSVEIVLTSGEVLAEEDAPISIEADKPDADTKVKTAVAWLERSRFLQRDENHVRVFPGSLKVASLQEAAKRLEQGGLSPDMRDKYVLLLTQLINAREDEGVSTDELMMVLGVSSQACIGMLHQLEKLEILANDVPVTVLLRKGVKDASSEVLSRILRLELALLDLLPELAPDADQGEWQDLDLRSMCQAVKGRADVPCLPDQLLRLVHTVARTFAERDATRRAMIDVRAPRQREVLRLRVLRPWSDIRAAAQVRQKVSVVLLNCLLAKLGPGVQGADLRIDCKLGELAAALRADLEVGPLLPDEQAAIEPALLYLHDHGVLILDKGKSVFRSAMTLRMYPEEKARRFTVEDYRPLKEYYEEKTFQVHVIQEYARLGLDKHSAALRFVMAYFTLPKLEFTRQYFAGRKDALARATTEESYRRIVEDLRHPIQQRIVCEKPEGNRLILAGPGSGKTRVIVHRVGYLVRVLREPATGIVVLAFNRAAAWEIRQRLYRLLGNDAAGVTVLTYHALAMRLTGTSLTRLTEEGQEQTTERAFAQILNDAIALLKGGEGPADGAEEPDEVRERLLAGYRHILVDEYQDIDAQQYALISGLAGRTLKDPDAKLTLLAVGDDDQNIYAFRGTSNDFIRAFQQDYQATTEYLVENYRSSAHISAAANRVIGGVGERLKLHHPIRIDFNRKNAPPGGRWAQMDPVCKGRVHVLSVADEASGQAEAVMAELRRLKGLDPTADWSDFAVLGRNRATLDPIRAWCELECVPYVSFEPGSSQPKLHQTREGQTLVRLLRDKPMRSVRADALPRWFALRFAGGHPDNAWQLLLSAFIDELHGSWGEQLVPASTLIEALYSFGNEALRSERGRLVLSTVHGTKGREFRHVVLLDGGDWTVSSEEERRLYYVGMTRAKETLLLCQGRRAPNPFTVGLEGEDFVRCLPGESLVVREGLHHRFFSLGLGEVDLGFAGRYAQHSSVHLALERLQTGHLLELCNEGGRYELRDRAGTVVGRLAKKTQLPELSVLSCRVESLVWRTSRQTAEEYRSGLKVEGWWVVLPAVVMGH